MDESQGFCYKVGIMRKWVNLFHGWKERKCTLKGNLFIYRDLIGKKIRTITLDEAEIKMSPTDPLKIIINYGSSIFEFKTASVPEKIEWIDAIRQAKLEYEKVKELDGDPDYMISPPSKKSSTNIVIGDRKPRREVEAEEEDPEKLKQELISIIEKRFLSESNELSDSMSKMWNLSTELEDTLGELTPQIYDMVVAKPHLSSLLDKLEFLSAELKNSLSLALTQLRKKNEKLKNIEIQKRFEEYPGSGIIGEEEEKKSTEIDLEAEDEFYDAIDHLSNESKTSIPDTFQLQLSPNETLDSEPKSRSCLPKKRNDLQKISAWGVLKEMIGKDLTRFAVPVYFNEPLSMLQKTAESLDNEDLLQKASTDKDSLMRIAYLTAYYIGEYGQHLNRTRKPFNPLLGETFELVSPDFKFLAEQVSHHPPISAFHCESEQYEFWGNNSIKTVFWGKSLECKPMSKTHFIGKYYNEHFTLERPTSACCNILIGKMYIDQYGEMVLTNYTTGEKAIVKFRKRNWSGKKYGMVQGTIYTSEGKPAYSIEGKWMQEVLIRKIYIDTGDTPPPIILWKKKPNPPDWEAYYHFPKFTYQLNYLPDSYKRCLPPTDTRLRPDQRALENGNQKLASTEKRRLEEKQRAARKERENRKDIYHCKHFVEYMDDLTGESGFKYLGEYFKRKEELLWDGIPRIFEE